MKCQNLFSGKNKKKYFKMLAAENFSCSAKREDNSLPETSRLSSMAPSGEKKVKLMPIRFQCLCACK